MRKARIGHKSCLSAISPIQDWSVPNDENEEAEDEMRSSGPCRIRRDMYAEVAGMYCQFKTDNTHSLRIEVASARTHAIMRRRIRTLQYRSRSVEIRQAPGL